MIIKEIKIKNFRSYYGDDNVFKFSKGLTLILGDNGDGKTTFFEALQWLFNTTEDRGREVNISEKRKQELAEGESDEVSVTISFDHGGEKSVSKSFVFEKQSDSYIKVSSVSFNAYVTNGTERDKVEGKQLINRCYDAFIQRFSMFKGESELNVFNDSAALKQLVDKFSDIRQFDELVKHATAFAEKSETAYTKELKSDSKVSKEAQILDKEKEDLAMKISRCKKEMKEKIESEETFANHLETLGNQKETAEKYQDLKARLQAQQEKLNKAVAAYQKINYNYYLLDRYWILCAFSPIMREYFHKVQDLNKQRRKLDTEFIKAQASSQGKMEAVKEIQGALSNGATELPWFMQDQETMEEMLHDHICKVCGRPFEDGSEAHAFMMRKLEEYKKNVELKMEEQKEKEGKNKDSMFTNNYIGELHRYSVQFSGQQMAEISAYPKDINEMLFLEERRKKEAELIEEKIKDVKEEISRLIIQSGAKESELDKNFSDVKGLFEQKERAHNRYVDLKYELKDLEQKMSEVAKRLEDLAPGNSQVKILKEVNQVMQKIAEAFERAKKENLRRFLNEMEDKANFYIERLSADDFHGQIRLVQTADESAQIKLYSNNTTEVKKPSGSQETVMYISVLFAISDFTQEKRDEDYPLIFDAATSSFGDQKEDGFYNVINGIKKQCIIVTKDFMTKGEVRHEDIEKLNCPVYRIKKADDFDPQDLSTVRTTVRIIKSNGKDI